MLEDNEDVNLWSNLSCFDFDFWMSDETNKRKEGGYQGKTAYKLMMKTFSWTGYNKHPTAAAECFAINMMRVEISPSFTGATAAGADSIII